MNHARVLYHMVRADFLERVRRYSFLLTLAFAAYLAWGSATGLIVVRLGEYRGVLNSAWLGSTMTLVSTLFVSLVGFYIVKNAILRDEQTRVGRIQSFLHRSQGAEQLHCAGIDGRGTGGGRTPHAISSG